MKSFLFKLAYKKKHLGIGLFFKNKLRLFKQATLFFKQLLKKRSFFKKVAYGFIHATPLCYAPKLIKNPFATHPSFIKSFAFYKLGFRRVS
jgi:hypothetical protein